MIYPKSIREAATLEKENKNFSHCRSGILNPLENSLWNNSMV